MYLYILVSIYYRTNYWTDLNIIKWTLSWDFVFLDITVDFGTVLWAQYVKMEEWVRLFIKLLLLKRCCYWCYCNAAELLHNGYCNAVVVLKWTELRLFGTELNGPNWIERTELGLTFELNRTESNLLNWIERRSIELDRLSNIELNRSWTKLNRTYRSWKELQTELRTELNQIWLI